jgi:hypothetical protein
MKTTKIQSPPGIQRSENKMPQLNRGDNRQGVEETGQQS